MVEKSHPESSATHPSTLDQGGARDFHGGVVVTTTDSSQ